MSTLIKLSNNSNDIVSLTAVANTETHPYLKKNKFNIITSSNNDHVVRLPRPSTGDTLRVMSITSGCEIRPYLTTTALSSGEFTINGDNVTTDNGTVYDKELEITDEIVYYAVATSTTNWNVSTGTRLAPD
jgi:hypothetical protein